MDANTTQSAGTEVGSSFHPTSVPSLSVNVQQATQEDPNEAITPAVDVAAKPKSSSKAWKDFIKLDGEWAQCKHCNKKLKSGSQKNAVVGNPQGVDILFPVTSHIPSYDDWGINGTIKHVESKKFKKKSIILRVKSRGKNAFQKEYWLALYWYSNVPFLNWKYCKGTSTFILEV
ncbi:hypothetical protein C5167_031464 [Papaver somniferum]|uniref:BED-type domain-containing protein n=1 Tax=Papaver somniferum TaxID=3469 RepID=A0A4Y7K880_PAPSO|nr:hypothetical protein C5167_031464 [Papaver somniferum]